MKSATAMLCLGLLSTPASAAPSSVHPLTPFRTALRYPYGLDAEDLLHKCESQFGIFAATLEMLSTNKYMTRRDLNYAAYDYLKCVGSARAEE